MRRRFASSLAALALLASGVIGTSVNPAAAAPAAPPAATTAADKADPTATVASIPLPGKPATTKADKVLPKTAKQFKRPPANPVTAKAKASSKLLTSCAPAACYYYNTGSQGFSSGTYPDGIFANLSLHNPGLDTSRDYHTLAELAAIKTVGGTRQIVEVGWNVDQVVNGNTSTHLFVYHWVNGATSCYNGCGFVAAGGATYTAGQVLTGSSIRFGIQYTSGNWWIWVGTTAGVGSWIGYFPATLWTGAIPAVNTFTNLDNPQVFGEVAAGNMPDSQVCTRMGDGVNLGSATAGASIGSVLYPNLATSAVNLGVWEASNPNAGTIVNYEPYRASARTLRYGGPGAGPPGSC